MSEESNAGAGPAPAALPPHGLRWAIKHSFVGYVSRMPDGRGYISGGAGATETNEFVFPLAEEGAPASDDGAVRTFAFGGSITFTGHFGLLYVQIAQPRITVREGEAELTVADPESKEGGRLPLATLALTGPVAEDGNERWEATDVRLTPQGVELFGDVYQAGEPLEPLAVIVPAS